MINFNKLTKFLGIFFIYFIKDLIYLLPLFFLNINYNSLSIIVKIILMLGSDIIMAIILGIIYRDYLKEKWYDFKNNFHNYLDKGLKAWIIGLAVMIVANNILAIFSPIKEAVNETSVQTIINASPILALILTTILAPFNEELIFRKSVKDFIPNKCLFVIISGLIFGYVHVMGSETIYDFLYIIPYGALGSAFAYALNDTDNIYTTMLTHLIHNGILTIISII